MAVSPRLIRRRIKSIGNTRKITKAMELVAASKMRRATAAALASRRYAAAGWEMIAALTSRMEKSVHPLMADRPARKVCVVLLSSHRGLAGGFNANIIKRVLTFVRDLSGLPGVGTETKIDFVTVGRKGEDALRRLDRTILASFATIQDTPSFADARPIATLLREEFVSGAYDRVYLAYTDFVSPIVQKPRVRQLLPLSSGDVQEMLRGLTEDPVPSEGGAHAAASETLFEPSVDVILEALLPKMTDLQVYQALLESAASEHSSRMVAMKSASDAAGDMIDDLTFTFNQARQAAITREISEIAAGKAALER